MSERKMMMAVVMAMMWASHADATCVSHSTSTYTFTNCSGGSSSISHSIGSRWQRHQCALR